jgi:predicted small lipoprotein YifL
MKLAILSTMITLIALAGCGSPGPVYRGDPPPGYTDAQYIAKLTGKSIEQKRPSGRFGGRTGERSATK